MIAQNVYKDVYFAVIIFLAEVDTGYLRLLQGSYGAVQLKLNNTWDVIASFRTNDFITANKICSLLGFRFDY